MLFLTGHPAIRFIACAHKKGTAELCLPFRIESGILFRCRGIGIGILVFRFLGWRSPVCCCG